MLHSTYNLSLQMVATLKKLDSNAAHALSRSMPRKNATACAAPETSRGLHFRQVAQEMLEYGLGGMEEGRRRGWGWGGGGKTACRLDAPGKVIPEPGPAGQ